MSGSLRKEFLGAEPMPSVANAIDRSVPFDRAVFAGVEAAAELIRVCPEKRLANMPLGSDLVDDPDVATRTLARMINDSLHRQTAAAGLQYPLYNQWAISKCADAELRFSRIVGGLIDPNLDYTKKEKQDVQVVVDDQGEPFILRKRRASSALTLQPCIVEGIRLPEGFIVDVDFVGDNAGRNEIAKGESSWTSSATIAGICPGRLSAFAIAGSACETYFPTDWLEEPLEPGLASQAFREFDIPTIRNVARQAIENGIVVPK